MTVSREVRGTTINLLRVLSSFALPLLDLFFVFPPLLGEDDAVLPLDVFVSRRLAVGRVRVKVLVKGKVRMKVQQLVVRLSFLDR